MLDDRAPHPHLGAGYPRVHDILTLLAKSNHEVTFVPCVTREPADAAAGAIPPGITYRAEAGSHADIARFVEAGASDFDVLWVSRPHNMAMLQSYIPRDHPMWQTVPLVVYDAEAIYSRRAKLKQYYYPDESPDITLEREMGLARVADVIAVVSADEGGYFEGQGMRTVVLGNCQQPVSAPPEFDRTRGFLFVGAMHGIDSPNVDAVAWFCQYVAPLLRAELGDEFRLDVAGIMSGVKMAAPAGDDICLLGMVPDLSQAYAEHRVFIAPHRFAAGIPLKILEASAHGLPVVASSLLADQLGWRHGSDIFAVETDNAGGFADACLAAYTDAAAWRRVQQGALDRIAREYSADAFGAALEALLATCRDKTRVDKR